VTEAPNPFEPPRTAVADAPLQAPPQRPVIVSVALFIMALLILRAAYGLSQVIPLLAQEPHYSVSAGMQAFNLALTSLLAVFIALGRNWARIVYLVYVLLSLGMHALTFVVVAKSSPGALKDLGWNWVVTTSVPYLATIVIVVILFGPGRAWFARRD
jgi:hypothetical protein